MNGCSINCEPVGLRQLARDLGIVSDSVLRDLALKQAFNTTTTVKNSSVTLFALDALAGAITDIQIEFFLADDVAATFTPDWYATREGDPLTFTERAISDIPAIATPAAAKRYHYEYGDLPEGGQLEFRIAQDNNGNATNDIDAVLTYKERA